MIRKPDSNSRKRRWATSDFDVSTKRIKALPGPSERMSLSEADPKPEPEAEAEAEPPEAEPPEAELPEAELSEAELLEAELPAALDVQDVQIGRLC